MTGRTMGPALTGTLVALAISIAGCSGQVDPGTPDPSPPSLTIDAFGIPKQPGASTQDNPETLTVAGCDIATSLRARST